MKPQPLHEPEPEPEPAPLPARAWIRTNSGDLRPITDAIGRDFTITVDGKAYHHVDDAPDGTWIYSA